VWTQGGLQCRVRESVEMGRIWVRESANTNRAEDGEG
jgi:hypothetical protein